MICFLETGLLLHRAGAKPFNITLIGRGEDATPSMFSECCRIAKAIELKLLR